MEFTPASARHAAQNGQIEAWLHAFLTTGGNNLPLSDGLKLSPRWYLGPVWFPLALLTRCLGPEAEMEYLVLPDQWEAKTAAMRVSIAAGWQPPPLLAMYCADGVLSVRDGNNRHGALTRYEMHNYWTIFWFNHPDDLCRFTEGYARYL